MKLVLTSPHFWTGAGLCATFWVTARYLPTNVTLLISNSFMMAASTAVAVAYLPAVVRAVRSRKATRVQCILLGIFYSWFFNSLWRIHSLLWLRAGSPEWFIQNDLLAFYQSGVTLGALYHLLSPGAIGGDMGERMPMLKWVVVGGVAGIAVLIITLLAGFDISTKPLVDSLRGYVPGAPP